MLDSRSDRASPDRPPMMRLMETHQMVPNPSYFDSVLPSHLKSDYMSHHYQAQTIRQPMTYPNLNSNSRPSPQTAGSLHGNPNLFSLAASFRGDISTEHSLRRKTPSGTIDNGYDGSHLASGPPPLKHMILPATTRIFPTAMVDRASNTPTVGHQRPLPAAGWAYPTVPHVNGVDSGGLERIHSGAPPLPAVGGWGVGPAGPGPNSAMGHRAPLLQPAASLPQASYHPIQGLQRAPVPTFSQPENFTPFSSLGLQQAESWRDGNVRALDYRNAMTLSHVFPPHNAVVDSTFIPSPSLRPDFSTGLLVGPTHAFGTPLPSRPLDDGFSRYTGAQSLLLNPQRRLEALSLGPPSSGQQRRDSDMLSPTRFKERVLAHAHKTYADLLVYLSQFKKVHHSRSSSMTRFPSEMVVFPKTPRLPASLGTSNYTDLSPPYNQRLSQPQTLAQSLGNGQVSPDAVNSVFTLSHPTMAAAEMFRNPYLVPTSYAAQPHRILTDVHSPFSNANYALEMLTNLCDQSGWKWMDGMLLGGCLHYGLEHYEEALEWFRRILNLDESHVEAMSNIAATLYCLNRHEEAERHWWRSIQIRPSYLAAAEHLVGLLCSCQRNQEAIILIEYIQDALRLSKSDAQKATVTVGETTAGAIPGFSPDTSRHPCQQGNMAGSADALPANDSGKQPGFGSSGYAVPGCDNGRIILLIHAKANILYALKEVGQAAEAFEEAVLVSAGRHLSHVQALIRAIQLVVAVRRDEDGSSTQSPRETLALSNLLLPPGRAMNTARLVFAGHGGQLPGLGYVPDGSHRKSAIATTSNSLLSLAKIYQDAVSNGAPGNQHVTGVGDILALYYLSMSLQESPSTANNVGILLASVPQSASAVAVAETSMATTIAGIVPGSGLSLALAYYHYGLSLDSKHVHLHTNLGSLLKDIGQLDMAISMYENAVACDSTFDIALTNLANAVKDKGRINDAIMFYRRAVTSNPDFAEAVCGLSTALNSVCDWRGRGGIFLHGGAHDRWHVDNDGMLQDAKSQGFGSGLMKRVVDIVSRQLRECASWGRGLLTEEVVQQLGSELRAAGAQVTDPSLVVEAELRKWAGRPWEGSRVLRLVERSIRASTRAWYQDKYIRGVEVAGGYRRPKLPPSLTVPTAPTILPFHTFTCPLTAKDIRMISERNAARISCSTLRSSWLPATVYEPPKPPEPFLKVGYVSSDFNNHPLAHLMQSVFGFHDPRRAKAFCYATTASDKSVHRQKIEREAPVFRDVSSWSSDKLIEQIVKDGIHILVNLNGYTRGARNDVFSARPAPIQMSFMGFAGTLGAEWCDYLLADTTAVPPSTLRPYRRNLNLTDVFRDEEEADRSEWVYSENLIYCRDTFFCCDHAQSADEVDERGMTWEAEQERRWKMRKELFPHLPDDTIIFGNFNQLYKIEPTTFRTWLRILSEVKKSVLWLLRFPDLGESNLRRTAKLWAGEEVASRLIFTDVAQKQQHIARARVCDLFLDTPECNAHTTAADVLWSSTPLLTLPRYEYKMCSRMAASILKGALPPGPAGEQAAAELITADEQSYECTAVRLAASFRYRITEDGWGEGVGRLAELRKLLWRSKWTCALFDTRRWVRDLEDAYDEAWRRWVAGQSGDIYL